MNQPPSALSTSAVLVAVACYWLCHLVEASSLGAKIPAPLRPKLAALAGFVVGVAMAVARGEDLNAAVVGGGIALLGGGAGVSGLPPAAPGSSLPLALRRAAAGTVTAALCLALAGCAAAMAALNPLVAACEFVPARFGTVCREALPVVEAIATDLEAVAGEALDPATCARAQITADGKLSLGVVCVALCGDMAGASEADPCPAVDFELRQRAAAAAALAGAMQKVSPK